ncbi:MAG: PadR family transcriptional regulator, partial [Oscillospiraceae bacterium]|nr:PadR family transcriptional regulator [Oscillospiraceae bacterium]MDR0248139.1 PadR family transcriptional regulator [Oscillospiraceae bacterium]
MAVRDNIVGGALTETTFLVLLAFHRPNHGYGVMQFIE